MIIEVRISDQTKAMTYFTCCTLVMIALKVLTGSLKKLFYRLDNTNYFSLYRKFFIFINGG